MSVIPDQELDYHYSPSRWSHRLGPQEVIESHINVTSCATREAQWCLDVETDISYGPSPKQKLDVYTQKNSSGKKGSPIFVYLHGGYWQVKEIGLGNSGFMAEPLTAAGATVIAVGYEICPDVSLDEIVNEVKQAMYFVFKLAKERHSSGIYLSGHSAGAHLASLLLMSSFDRDDAFDCELIKGAALFSGVYDLRPLVKTPTNNALRLTEEDAWRFSPAQFVDDLARMCTHRDILIAVAEYDPPEFRRQSAEFDKALRDRGVKTRFIDVPDTDHFNIVERLKETNYSVTKECIRLMKLNSK